MCHQLVPALVDAITENGTAALHTAARQAHVKVVTELLSAGASASLRDLGGQTALGAAYDGLQAVAKYVEEALSECVPTPHSHLDLLTPHPHPLAISETCCVADAWPC